MHDRIDILPMTEVLERRKDRRAIVEELELVNWRCSLRGMRVVFVVFGVEALVTVLRPALFRIVFLPILIRRYGLVSSVPYHADVVSGTVGEVRGRPDIVESG